MDINDFFDCDEIRDYMREPFNIGDRTIATDGHSILSQPKIGDYQDCKSSFLPTINNILNDVNRASFSRLNKFDDPPEQIVCEKCKGTKKASVKKCHECDGDGYVDAETDYNTYSDLVCISCNGNGEIIDNNSNDDCNYCQGTGKSHSKTACIHVSG